MCIRDRDDREEFDRLVDYYWDHVPAYFMDRDDSTTWFMNLNKKLTVEDSQTLAVHRQQD